MNRSYSSGKTAMSYRHVVVIALISAAAFVSAREPESAMPASVAISGAWLRVQGDGRYSAGQPTAEQLQTLSAHGIGVVIDLRVDSETPELDEAALVRSHGLDYHNLPVGGAAGLTRGNVLALDRLIADAGDRPLLVHCASGNRVGAMMALREAWLRGATSEHALEVGRSWGMKGLESDVNALLQTKVQATVPSEQSLGRSQRTPSHAQSMRADTSD
jgi:uncharacterized protein (TIGR01244 family)